MKIEVIIPNNLNEITLGQYQKFLSIAENNKEGEFLNAKMIEIFCGISLADTYNLKRDLPSIVKMTFDEVHCEKKNIQENYKELAKFITKYKTFN